MLKNRNFHLFLFFIHDSFFLIYICLVAMLRHLKIEENDYEKDFRYCGCVVFCAFLLR